MATPRKCSRCGAELPPDVPGGHCLPCLLQLGLAAAQEMEAEAPTEPGGPPPASLRGLPTEKTGDRIDRYKLLQQIGEGGCGVVYMAEQEEPVQRRVALKVIKPGMDSKSVIARFEAERQALALMDHPNIAKVFDAGTTASGLPYFVMELVRGIKITEYCDQQNLSTRQRLDLFVQVCRAIQHAHQKGLWNMAIPAAQNPSVFGNEADIGLGQPDHLWFVPPVWGDPGGPVERSFTIPAGKALFVPVFIAAADNSPCAGGTPTSFTVEDFLGFFSPVLDTAIMEVEVDGATVNDITDHRFPTVFTQTYSDGDFSSYAFGCQIEPGLYYPAVADGYALILPPFSVGQHVIHEHIIPAFGAVADNTFHFIVMPARK